MGFLWLLTFMSLGSPSRSINKVSSYCAVLLQLRPEAKESAFWLSHLGHLSPLPQAGGIKKSVSVIHPAFD